MDKECIHLFTLGMDGYHSVVCKKCGLSFGFENRRPRNIDAPNNNYCYDRFYTFSEYYDIKKENEKLKKKLATSDNSSKTKDIK